MGWACGTNGGEERCIPSCSGETRKTDNREDLNVDIKMDCVEKQGGRAWTGLIWLRVVDWIDLAQGSGLE